MKKAALIIPTNNNGDVLLQHKDSGAPNNPNTWCLFGGGVENNESFDEAIKREIEEELGIKLKSFEFYTSYNDSLVQRQIFTTKIYKTAEELLANLTEGDNLGFFSWTEIESMDIAEPHRKILAKFFNIS